jgi:small subunit ribosomal protein S8
MTMTDPIADMLTRIRNANVAMHDDVTMPSSKLKESLAAVLQKEGYIQAFRVDQEEGKPSKTLTIDMKYSEARERVITGIRRVSKPGLRVYTKADSPGSSGAWVSPSSRPARVCSPIARLVASASVARSSATSGRRRHVTSRTSPHPGPVRGRGQDRGPRGHREGPQG